MIFNIRSLNGNLLFVLENNKVSGQIKESITRPHCYCFSLNFSVKAAFFFRFPSYVMYIENINPNSLQRLFTKQHQCFELNEPLMVNFTKTSHASVTLHSPCYEVFNRMKEVFNTFKLSAGSKECLLLRTGRYYSEIFW